MVAAVDEFDVVVVGASIAGCTAARMFGDAGWRVALLERKADAGSYKAMCGHFILGGTKPTLDRLGLWDRMVAAGATPCWATVWSGDGWIEPVRDEVPPAIALRRSTLDPLLRRLAQDTPGVDLLLDMEVVELLRSADGAIAGVVARGPSGERTLRSRLVVGADGHRSAVGRLTGAETSTAPNGRFFWWAYYRGVELNLGAEAQIWPADPDGAVAVPAGEGLHLLGAFASKAHLAEFAADRIGALERYIAARPDAPDLSHAECVSKVIGTNDYPFVKRNPLPAPGVALIGDAAMASDPLPAVGCGWAFRSAEWLADATLPALRGDEPLSVGLGRYRAARAEIEEYDALARDDARDPRPVPVQLAVRRAAQHDRELARRLGMFAMRAAPPDVLLNADTMERVGASLKTP